jgi:hypothetical protein
LAEQKIDVNQLVISALDRKNTEFYPSDKEAV